MAIHVNGVERGQVSKKATISSIGGNFRHMWAMAVKADMVVVPREKKRFSRLVLVEARQFCSSQFSQFFFFFFPSSPATAVFFPFFFVFVFVLEF